MCFWWYNMASFLELSPGNRKSCGCLKEQMVLRKSQAPTSQHSNTNSRGDEGKQEGRGWKEMGLREGKKTLLDIAALSGGSNAGIEEQSYLHLAPDAQLQYRTEAPNEGFKA